MCPPRTVKRVHKSQVMHEFTVDKGRRVRLAEAHRSDHRFYENIVMPINDIQHRWLLRNAIRTFTSRKWTRNPSLRKPGGTNRVMRLIFRTILALRDCFTASNHNVPIRESQLENRATALANHMWSELSTNIPPKKVEVWLSRMKINPPAQKMTTPTPVPPIV